MVKQLRIKILVSALVISFGILSPAPSYAQTPDTQEKAELSGTRKQIATIVFAGLAGMILGLSTLSFYGRPQEKLGNIAIGFAVGVIGGAIFTTYKAATVPYEAYDLEAFQQAPASERHYELSQLTQITGAQNNEAPFQAPSLSWEFRF